MGKDSRIEWTHHTFNPWWGCVKVSPACDNCYAETWAKRLGEGLWGPQTPRRFFSESHWKEPLRWDRDAAKDRVRRRVFCASMADVFENRDDLREPRLRLLSLIAETPNLDWLLLTKRIHLVRKQLPPGYEFPRNVWLGATVENQASANKRIKHLLQFSSPSVRFLSCEPLLSAIDLSDFLRPNQLGNRVDWVIAGGESGAHSRPMDPRWPADIQQQCFEAKVPFHFKQWGHWAPLEYVAEALRKSTPIKIFRQDQSEVSVAAVGKGKTGRVLLGRHWDQFPKTSFKR